MMGITGNLPGFIAASPVNIAAFGALDGGTDILGNHESRKTSAAFGNKVSGAHPYWQPKLVVTPINSQASSGRKRNPMCSNRSVMLV
jgi:hypothetical protein